MFQFIIQTLITLLVLCLILFYFFCRYNYGYWQKRGIPYEEPTMFFGNLGGVLRTSVFHFMYNLKIKHKTDYIGIFLGWKPTLVINSKELAKKILVKDFNSFRNRHSYSGAKDDPLGTLNLFTIKDPLWSTMRHELAPMFTSLRLKGITELMNLNAAQLVQKIQRDHVDNKEPINLKELFLMYASDVVGFTVFGLRVSALKDLTSPLWSITRHMVHFTFRRGFEFTMIFFAPVIAKLLRLKFFSAAATDNIRKLFWNVVKERKNIGKTEDKDLVNMLLKLKENLKLPGEAGSQLNDDIMLAQVGVFILGAIDTSANTLSFCLHELAYHPQEQEKLYMEISQALQQTGKDVLDFNDLLQVHYLTACIKETLRKYPTLAFLDRVCNEEYKLTDGVTIEKGTPVYINVLAIHYNEEYFPEPEVWRPERFGLTVDNDNHDFTFLPFGGGPRFCIGKRYGMMQMRSALAHMVMRFKFEPADAYKLKIDPYSLLVSPKNGGKVKFIAR